MSALRALDGFPAHDAEDLYLTLLFSASPWHGVYVPEVLAMGTTPVDWRGYLGQQRRWARALIDLKLRVFPGLARGMTIGERVVGLLHGAYYLRPLVLLLWYTMLVYMLVANVQPSFYHWHTLFAGFSLTMVFWVGRPIPSAVLPRPRARGRNPLALARASVRQVALLHEHSMGRSAPVAGRLRRRRASRTRPTRGGASRSRTWCSHWSWRSRWPCAWLLHDLPRPALLWSAIAFITFSLLLACTEAMRFPPQFEPGLHARRRALLARRLDRR